MWTFGFHFSDLGVISFLALLEGLLSADNALVLAILVRHLPQAEQKKALFYGLGGALVFRLLGVLAAAWIISLWYLRAAGGLYLFYLCILHFLNHRRESVLHEPEAKTIKKAGFWKTVALVELTDVAFAVDSILVAVAVSSKLWVVWIGGFVGIVAMRLVANFFIRLIERFPVLTHYAYVLVGWAALKLLAQSYDSYHAVVLQKIVDPLMPKWLFWTGMGVIVVLALLEMVRHKKRSKVSSS